MVTTGDLLSNTNPVFASYVFWGTIVLLKMFCLALLTSMKRGAKGVSVSILLICFVCRMLYALWRGELLV
jgi:hypothetical protein